jgi:hypothetical protein
VRRFFVGRRAASAADVIARSCKEAIVSPTLHEACDEACTIRRAFFARQRSLRRSIHEAMADDEEK